MKTCAKCRTEKPLSDFNKASGRPDGVQAYCRLCQRGIDKDFYNRNESRKERVRGTQAAARQAARLFLLAYLRTHPCVDCGESDLVCLDFDHVRGVKVREVSYMARSGWKLDTIRQEIAKCDVRCANCHRKITAKRHGGWWIALLDAQGDE